MNTEKNISNFYKKLYALSALFKHIDSSDAAQIAGVGCIMEDLSVEFGHLCDSLYNELKCNSFKFGA